MFPKKWMYDLLMIEMRIVGEGIYKMHMVIVRDRTGDLIGNSPHLICVQSQNGGITG